MKYIISTLGCKVNQYETQALETMLNEKGLSAAGENDDADLIIVNTCAVTAESGRKSRQAIRSLKEKYPTAKVAVCGCYSQVSPEDIERIGADVIFGSGDRVKFIEAVLESISDDSHSLEIEIDVPFKRNAFEVLDSGAFSGRTRAMLKIQDGCNNFCTYCIIPYARGKSRSISIEDAVSQVRKLKECGYREIVVTGIEIASYGLDLPGKPKLEELLAAIAREAPDIRLRLGSLEPTIITDEFCRKIAETGSICRQFHLSLQSGCDKTLKAMNRKYDTSVFYDKICLLKKYFEGCAITADLIVGFPGESERDFQDTLDFIEKCGFSQIHIFPYSRRKGTPADKMKNQLTHFQKAARAREAKIVAERIRADYLENSVGKILPVLFETEDESVWSGHSDTYVLVNAKGENLRGLVKNVKITSVDDQILVGEIID